MESCSIVLREITYNTMIELLKGQHCDEEIADLETLDSDASYEEFFTRFMFTNKPCKFSPSLTHRWISRRLWIDENGRPRFEFLKENFGLAVAPVANCDVKSYNSHCKEDMLVKEYLSYWEKCRIEKTANLYLKDWHFSRAFPDYTAYSTPVYFTSDWLNEFLDYTNQDDYRFVYMGPKGSWTPFHADVFGSYSWSTNVCGRKKWLLVPPGQEKQFTDTKGSLIFDIQQSDKKNVDNIIEVIQEAGETIFIPSGWHHQVWNLEDTISINHNWFNGCNIIYICQELHSALKLVQKEIDDCKDDDGWNLQCQVLLKAHHGMNWNDLYEMLEYIGNRSMSVISNIDSGKGNIWHEIFDLLQVAKSLQYIIDHDLLIFNSECNDGAKLLYTKSIKILARHNVWNTANEIFDTMK